MATSTRHRSTSWDEIGWAELPDGALGSAFKLGSTGEKRDPVVFKLRFPPGCTVEPHHHETDYAEIILDGEQRVGRTWYRSGDIRIVEANTRYGPLEAGPSGCTVLVIFRDGHWPAVFGRPRTRHHPDG